MRLVNVYRESSATKVLYRLLCERPPESRISHVSVPSYRAHARFVRSRPYRYWYLVRVGEKFIGELCVTDLNEIGIHLFDGYRHCGHGEAALRMFIRRHRPLPAITAKRVGAWLANIAPENENAKFFFAKMGFEKCQETWRL